VSGCEGSRHRGIALRRESCNVVKPNNLSIYLHDQYARRAALDSSPDDNQHELLTSRRIETNGRTQMAALKMHCSRRSHPAEGPSFLE
jgi:hypothetical protein